MERELLFVGSTVERELLFVSSTVERELLFVGSTVERAHARLVAFKRAHGRMIAGTSPWKRRGTPPWNEPMHARP